MYHLQPNGFSLPANNLANLGCIYFSSPFFYMINYIDRGRHLVNKTRLSCSRFVQVGTKCAHVCKKILEMLLQNVLS